jgi:ABC-type multidrug transport system fused ATPase/permease subunit
MNTFRDFARYLKIYRQYVGRRFYVVFVLTVAVAFTEGFGITLVLPLLRSTQGSAAETQDVGTAEEILQMLLTWIGIDDSIGGILLFIVVVFASRGLLSFAQKSYTAYLQSEILVSLKAKLFDAYSDLKYRHFLTENTGHFINVINHQANQFFGAFSTFVTFLTSVVTTLSYFAFAFAITWKFSLMVIAFGAVLLYSFNILNGYVRDLSREASAEMSDLNKLLVQTLQAFKYLVSTGQMHHLRAAVMKSVRRLTNYLFRRNIADAFTSSIHAPVSVTLIAAIIAVQVLVLGEPITPILVALILFFRGMESIMTIQNNWQQTMSVIGSVEMVDDDLSWANRHRENSGEHHLGPLSEEIRLDNVCFAYNEDDGDVLHNVTASIPANSTVALVGKSGAGKSTFVDMLTLMLRPRRGEIYIDGVPGREADHASWRPQIGYVSQETVVFDDTVANNISLWTGASGGASNDRTNGKNGTVSVSERVRDAARRAHADSFIRDLPDGYQTVVGDRGVRLSGGQRQRLFIARELYKEPNLLLLDEATSDLDSASERRIQRSIDALQGDVTVVIIAHRLSTVQNADRIYVLDEGRILEAGTYEELCSREESRFREMVEVQSL